MMRLATVADLEARLGRTLVDPVEAVRAEVALEDATVAVLAETGPLDELEPPEAARLVVLRVARRLFMNPDGYAQEGIGPHSIRLTDEAAGGLVTQAERMMLRAAIRRPAVGTIRTPAAWERDA
jgi:hypothetical protein